MATATEDKKAETAARLEKTVPKETANDIDQAIDQMVKEKESDAEESKPLAEDTPGESEETTADQGDEESEKSEESQEEETPGELEGDDESPEAEAKTDELLTRAVKAGIAIKDARTFAAQDADALERNIELLEKKTDDTSDSEEGKESVSAEDDLLAGFPELDPEVYDEKLVETVEAMKSIIRKQGETIKGLSSGNEKNYLDKQIDALKVKNIDEAKRTQLHDQFNVLKAGHAAKNQEADDGVLFEQAAKLVLGDEMKATKEAETSKKVDRRVGMQTSRPGGRVAKPKGSLLEEIAAEVDREAFGKK